MESLFIAPGVFTPEIRFDSKNSVLFFIGKSFPTDPVPFYKQVFEWLDNYLATNRGDNNLNLSFKLEYYNTSTSKQFAKLFKLLEDSIIHDKVEINWFYDDNDMDMLEAGQRFSQFTRLPFELLKNNSN